MPQLEDLNSHVGIVDQLHANEDGSVVLINVFTVDPGEEDALIAAWTHDAEYMRAQPGYISTQLHKGIGGSTTFLNYAVWESVESFRVAFSSPEFQERIAQYPDSAVAMPHLVKKIAVAGYCVA